MTAPRTIDLTPDFSNIARVGTYQLSTLSMGLQELAEESPATARLIHEYLNWVGITLECIRGVMQPEDRAAALQALSEQVRHTTDLIAPCMKEDDDGEET